jgi:hypothetical protein
MAKRIVPVRPARKKRRVDDDTLLIRSAESLGRVIGSLRRQLLAVRASASGNDEPRKRTPRRTSTARAKAKTAKPSAAARKTKRR